MHWRDLGTRLGFANWSDSDSDSDSFAVQVPILTENLDTALSKLCWAPTGHHLVTGDCEGRVSVFEAGEVSGK